MEPERGLFMAEGAKVIGRALDTGHRLVSVLAEEKWLGGLQDRIPPDVPVHVAAPDILEQITGYRVHRGALAAMQRKPMADLSDLLAQATSVAVLEDLVDHTNVGAIFRNAAALGIDAVVLSPACADPLYRRSVKVSMGTVFSVPWTRAQDWPASLDLLGRLGFTRLALTPGGQVDIRDLPGQSKYALMLGTEGDGLTAAAMSAADLRVAIPMRNGVDSLNVAAASAVAFFAVTGAATER